MGAEDDVWEVLGKSRKKMNASRERKAVDKATRMELDEVSKENVSVQPRRHSTHGLDATEKTDREARRELDDAIKSHEKQACKTVVAGGERDGVPAAENLEGDTICQKMDNAEAKI